MARRGSGQEREAWEAARREAARREADRRAAEAHARMDRAQAEPPGSSQRSELLQDTEALPQHAECLTTLLQSAQTRLHRLLAAERATPQRFPPAE